MAEIPENLQYTAEHEYIKTTADPGIVEVGITAYAQGELGDVVFVELPSPGLKFGAHSVFGTIEAVKAVSDLYCPLPGEIVESNARLDKEPNLVNTDPYGDGWMIRLRVSSDADRSSLMNADAYAKHTGQ